MEGVVFGVEVEQLVVLTRKELCEDFTNEDSVVFSNEDFEFEYEVAINKLVQMVELGFDINLRSGDFIVSLSKEDVTDLVSSFKEEWFNPDNIIEDFQCGWDDVEEAIRERLEQMVDDEDIKPVHMAKFINGIVDKLSQMEDDIRREM